MGPRVKAFVALAFLAAASSQAAAPTLLDLYQVGQMGFVEFRLQNGRYVGRYRGGGDCALQPDREVMNGVIEGNVFAGRVMLCQEGPACEPEKFYPFLGVFHGATMTGMVKLDARCTSLVLEGGQLRVTPATAEERAKYQGGSASALAANGKTKKQLEEEALPLIIEGVVKVEAGDYRPACDLLERGLAGLPDHREGLVSAGVARMALKNPAKAMEWFDRALAVALRDRAPADATADIHYNLACAQAALGKSREAVDSLRAAVKLRGAGALLDQLTSDKDLDPLRSDPEFKKLLAEAKKARGKGAR